MSKGILEFCSVSKMLLQPNLYIHKGVLVPQNPTAITWRTFEDWGYPDLLSFSISSKTLQPGCEVGFYEAQVSPDMPSCYLKFVPENEDLLPKGAHFTRSSSRMIYGAMHICNDTTNDPTRKKTSVTVQVLTANDERTHQGWWLR